MPPDLTAATVSFHFETPVTLRKRKALKEYLIRLFIEERKELSALTYVFCSDDYLLDVNRRFLDHDYYTDIITFDLSDDGRTVGEIYISVDRVRENARIHTVTVESELHRVIFHGALHLCGYKDKSVRDTDKMRAAENKHLEQYFR